MRVKPCLQQTNSTEHVFQRKCSHWKSAKRTELTAAPSWPSYTTHYWSCVSASRSWLAAELQCAQLKFSSVRLLWTRLYSYTTRLFVHDLMESCCETRTVRARSVLNTCIPTNVRKLEITYIVREQVTGLFLRVHFEPKRCSCSFFVHRNAVSVLFGI